MRNCKEETDLGETQKNPLLATSARSGAPAFHFLLEKSCGAAFPGLAFFLGDFFHIAYLRAGLRQDVVQVVANADEGETFFQEFTNPGGTKQE